MTLGIGDKNVSWLKAVGAKLQEICRDAGANALHVSAHEDYIRFSIRLTDDLLYTGKRYDGEEWVYTASSSGSRVIDVRQIQEALDGDRHDAR